MEKYYVKVDALQIDGCGVYLYPESVDEVQSETVDKVQQLIEDGLKVEGNSLSLLR